MEAKLVILGSIDFYFGLPINLIVNAEQNKFEVDILKNVAKIAKLGQLPLLSQNINGVNSIIFNPILNFLFLMAFFRDKSNSVKIKALSLLVKMLVFGPERA